MANVLFDSANLLLDRAREHRTELHLRSKSFFDLTPYTNFVERDPETGEYLRKVRLADKLPGFLFPIAADAINNLRSALDHAVCASARAANPGVDLKGVQFGFGKSDVEFERNVRSCRKKVPPEIMAVMSMFKPYKGGNNRLWGLSVLSNASKHRNLITLHARVESVNINLEEVFRNSGFRRPIWDSEKNELIIGVASDEEKLCNDLDVTFSIAFREAEVFGQMSALAIIDYLCAIVEGLLVGN